MVPERIRRLHEQRVTVRGQLAEQSSTLLDNHPRIKELRAQIGELDRQIRDETQSVARSLENDARIAGARVESLASGLEQLKRQAASTNEQDVELRAFEREAKAQRDLLELYLAKYREATARDSLDAMPSDVRIISRAAVSNTPYFPKKLPIVLIATLATLFIAAGFITTGELLAGNVYRPAAETITQAPVQAQVPAAPPAETVLVAPAASAAPAAPVAKRSWMPGFARKPKPAIEPGAAAVQQPAPAPTAEPGMTVADMAQALREAGATGKRIAVVGAEPDAGTSMTAIALARVLARDARVILVDLSLERPSLAAITADPRAPGIAELARGAASFGQVITRDRFSRAQVIPAGRVGADAAAIYQSERIAIGIDALARAYDHVIIDAGATSPLAHIARFAPCAVLIAGKVAADKVDAARGALANGGFSDIAVFTGTPPAPEADEMRGVAA